MDNVTWNNIESTDTDWTGAQTSEQVSYNETMTIANGEAWVIAVESCLNRLAKTTNSNTDKPILFPGPVTANTTIADVQGQVVVKINTNGANNEGDYWSGNTPALFSRWENGSAIAPLTVNLKWGSPIESTPLITGDDALHWCYTELDNIDTKIDSPVLHTIITREIYTEHSMNAPSVDISTIVTQLQIVRLPQSNLTRRFLTC